MHEKKTRRVQEEDDDSGKVLVVIPYVKGLSEHIKAILRRKDMKI